MPKNKYNYVIKDMKKLEEKAPNAIQVIKRPKRSQISKLIDLGVPLEEYGIEIVTI